MEGVPISASLVDVTEKIFSQLPPSTRFSSEDETLLLGLAPKLLPLEDALVRGFYDILFAHPQTAGVFGSGERSERENALRRWWRRTLGGPFDAQYWRWQAAVGLIHIRRGVTNPMMLAMWGWVLNALQEALFENLKLPPHEAARAMEALHRLAATVQALTAESYLRHYLLALSHSTGVSTDLIDRLVTVELASLDPSTLG
ncbi:Globin-coupled histidine kinase [Methylacidimicrobium cyclopophantes]|uniref:Globin-coupled histidine kinase n=1 Tax=Methylacidimicrobium cyclopophantes TaxID=1041766 RepID=A0A5E6MB61_9BACT|nr:protoglobin domain-containing protein [Methylacidimicrobium cyclopophantes]VVM06655.1 Globin-coupled histidine kinase [Methylacidimicrobium cyclopophantes]